MGLLSIAPACDVPEEFGQFGCRSLSLHTKGFDGCDAHGRRQLGRFQCQSTQEDRDAVKNRRQARVRTARGVGDGTDHGEYTAENRHQTAWGEEILHEGLFVRVIVASGPSGWLFSASNGSVSETSSAEVKEILLQIDADRTWLLQQIDSGRWPDLRLDLAALERELGQLITRASELHED